MGKMQEPQSCVIFLERYTCLAMSVREIGTARTGETAVAVWAALDPVSSSVCTAQRLIKYGTLLRRHTILYIPWPMQRPSLDD